MASLDRHWPAFLALVRQSGPAEPMFDFVAGLIGEAIGSKLTTATLFDVPAGRLRRLYTQNAEAYAVGGFKSIPDNQWTETLIGRQQIYTALSLEAIAVDFADWQLIGSLGCESIANLPIVVGGQTIGAFNLLHEAGYYTAERLARVDEVMPFATMAYLAAVFGERR
ncbi:hypothetical protein ASC89_22360 [Devosia sp. Root413D1]|uniref:hypothetical protein n=1 Tax=Devosia sp. Root413D1 TaxID=1736531 RepID=UPI0006F57DE5|nr:hypothetical protein [Devosia sp. Root413D1]KQW75679.1 hypothetical protein ASC89_22360 [Devosia sp. Root413D1]